MVSQPHTLNNPSITRTRSSTSTTSTALNNNNTMSGYSTQEYDLISFLLQQQRLSLYLSPPLSLSAAEPSLSQTERDSNRDNNSQRDTERDRETEKYLQQRLRPALSAMVRGVCVELLRRCCLVAQHGQRLQCSRGDAHFAMQSLACNLVLTHIPALLLCQYEGEGEGEKEREKVHNGGKERAGDDVDGDDDDDDDSFRTDDLHSESDDDELSEEGDSDRDSDDADDEELDLGEDLEYEDKEDFDDLTDESTSCFAMGSSDWTCFQYLTELCTELHCLGMLEDSVATLRVVQTFKAFLLREIGLSLEGKGCSLFTRLGFPPLCYILKESCTPADTTANQLAQFTNQFASQEKLLTNEQMQSTLLVSTLQDLIAALRSADSLSGAGLAISSPVATTARAQTFEECRTDDVMKTPFKRTGKADPLNGALQGLATTLKSSQVKVHELQEELLLEREEKKRLMEKVSQMKSIVASLHALTEDIPDPSSKMPRKLNDSHQTVRDSFSSGSAFSFARGKSFDSESASGTKVPLIAVTAFNPVSTFPYSDVAFEEDMDDNVVGTDPFDRLARNAQDESNDDVSSKKRKLHITHEANLTYLPRLDHSTMISRSSFENQENQTPSLFKKQR